MSIANSSGTAPALKTAWRILFVDDEETLARMTGKLLSIMGYHSDIFTESPDALKALTQQPDQYDLVITDLTMPDLSGLELAEAVKAIRPDMPVILSTGFSELLDEQEARSRGVDIILSKPLSMNDLKAGIEKALQNS